MSKEMAVILLGAWTIIVPYLGIPGNWRTILFALTGAAVVVLGFLMRSEALGHRPRSHKPHAGNLFVENQPDRPAGVAETADHSEHESKEGTTPLN